MRERAERFGRRESGEMELEEEREWRNGDGFGVERGKLV